METTKPPQGEPTPLHAHVTFEGNKIIIDRSEFPIEQYPAVTDSQLLKDAARMLDSLNLTSNK